jgi:hypothetical protein
MPFAIRGTLNAKRNSCNLIEARLQLAEQVQRLWEYTGEPPDDIKIEDRVGAAVYLQTVTSTLGKGFATKYVVQILNTLGNRVKDPKNPQYVKELASTVGSLRGDLIEIEKKGYEPNLAVHSILIAEAMTPEYSAGLSPPSNAGNPQYNLDKVATELAFCARGVQLRVEEEAAKEKKDEREIYPD